MSQSKGTERILEALRASDDPIEQMLKVAEAARENDIGVSSKWVDAWAKAWQCEREQRVTGRVL